VTGDTSSIGFVLLAVAVVFYGIGALQIRARTVYGLFVPVLRDAEPGRFWAVIAGEFAIATAIAWFAFKLMLPL